MIRLAVHDHVGHTMPVRSLVVLPITILPITILAANNMFILTKLSYSSNILQHNKPTRLKRINMFVTSTKYLLSALLLASVAENAYGQVSNKL